MNVGNTGPLRTTSPLPPARAAGTAESAPGPTSSPKAEGGRATRDQDLSRADRSLAFEADELPDALPAEEPPALETELLNGLYQDMLGRAPDGEGMIQFSKMIQARRAEGMSEDGIKQFVTDQIKSSAEYQAKTGQAGGGAQAQEAGANESIARPAATGAVTNGQPAKAGAVPYINQFEPGGKDGSYTNASSNCGPTSMAMIARSMGYGADLSDAQLINQLGQMGGTTSDGTGVNGIVAMANGIGQNAEMRGPGPNTDWIAQQLKAGKQVVANGDYFAMGDHNRDKIGQGGHFVAVVGLDEQGRFLVNDPADSGISPRAFSASELSSFIGANTNGGYQVAVG